MGSGIRKTSDVGEHALVLVESDGTVSIWNAMAERMTGRPRREVVGTHIRTLFANPHEVDAALNQAARRGDACRELQLRRPGGTPSTFDCWISTIPGRDGTIRAFGFVMVDVTAARHVRRTLAESEERFRLLAEHARDGIYRLRLHPDVAYEYVNPAMTRMTGVSAEELYDDPDMPLRRVHPEDLSTVLLSRQSPDKVKWPLEIRWDLSGEWRHLSFTEAPLYDDDGTLVATQGFMLDVTDQRARETALKDAVESQREAIERLEHTNQLKNAFLQAVSHELRTPLSAVRGYAQTLHRQDDKLQPETRQHILDRLDKNAERLADLLEDLLDLDRLQRGIIEPNLTRTDLARLVLHVVETLNAPHHRIDVTLAGDVTAIVDRSKVERIVENLVANAVKHTPPGTHVRIDVGRDDRGATVLVEDDGPGIGQVDLDEIFEPFRQGEDSLQRASPGTGIGLSLVRQFARLHGGEAWASHRPGGGTRFHVSLPDRSHDCEAAPTRRHGVVARRRRPLTAGGAPRTA